MKKTVSLFALIAIVATLFFSGCKKGENDPFLSLKTRTARLAQTWELSSEDYTTVSTHNGSTTTKHYTYDGTIETIVETDNGQSNTSTSTYSEEITFDKDGTYKLTINEKDDNGTFTSTEKGNWVWTNKIKGQDIKSKEAVMMIPTASSYSDTYSILGVDHTDSGNETYSGKTNQLQKFYVLDKLSSNELVILIDYEADSDGDTDTYSGTRTYTKK